MSDLIDKKAFIDDIRAFSNHVRGDQKLAAMVSMAMAYEAPAVEGSFVDSMDEGDFRRIQYVIEHYPTNWNWIADICEKVAPFWSKGWSNEKIVKAIELIQGEGVMPQGEWIFVGHYGLDNTSVYKCSHCDAETLITDYDNYCPACGSRNKHREKSADV